MYAHLAAFCESEFTRARLIAKCSGYPSLRCATATLSGVSGNQDIDFPDMSTGITLDENLNRYLYRQPPVRLTTL